MIKALLFDMDGTVLDTEPINKLAWERTLTENGYFYGEDFFEKCIGLNYAAMEVLYQSLYNTECRFTQICVYAHNIVDAYDAEKGVAIKKGFIELSDFLKEHGIKSYIVTSSKHKVAENRLSLAGILDRFDGIVGGDEVSRGKPDAEPYLKAAELAGAGAEECIAVEDSANGIKSAYGAKIRCIYIKDLLELPKEIEALSLCRLSSLDKIIGLFNT